MGVHTCTQRSTSVVSNMTPLSSLLFVNYFILSVTDFVTHGYGKVGAGPSLSVCVREVKCVWPRPQGRRRRAGLKEYPIPEKMQSTALPLLVVLGSLYLWWPSLCVPLFKWVLGLVGMVGVLIGVAMKLHSFESLATQGELFAAVKGIHALL